MTNTKQEYTVGQVVGWHGERCEVSYMSRFPNSPRIEVRRPNGEYANVAKSDLTDPPPLPDHVQQAAEEAVAVGIFSDPWGAVFGREES